VSAPEQSGDTAAAPSRGNRPTVTGTVVSDKMQSTIVVREERLVKHGLYKKFVRRATRFYAHDPEGEAHVGDEVEIRQTRPLSKLKRWRLVRVLRRAAGSTPDAAPSEEASS
jgi:small subunit ribosomal protein S17